MAENYVRYGMMQTPGGERWAVEICPNYPRPGERVFVCYQHSEEDASALCGKIERAIEACKASDPSVARLVEAARDYMERDEIDNWRKLQAALAPFVGEGGGNL